ncbi:hypothetical protein ACJBVY_02070 [Streptococcus suis]|uniref:hypothetical protein n=1 Tax=Streptococcus suis TaxID=1307 RepID=UPI000CF4D2B8|nr:hypothetical protein [Streptococcus suis]MBY5031868.1 hypothetical protein [Streptococcus suis]MBY5036406.1 hypothetical protein [Streptococcus suis]
MKRFVPLLILLLVCLTACQTKKADNIDDTAVTTSYIDNSDELYEKWQKNFRYAFVASDTSTLMTAGFSLRVNQEVELYRSGSELTAWNQGKTVRGTFRLKYYDKKESVETYLILDAKTATDTEPERIKVLPDLVVQIDVSEAELQKADPERKGDEKTTFYAYQTSDGILVLTNGKTDEDLQVFIASNDAVQTSSSVFPETVLGTWYGYDLYNNIAVYSRTFHSSGLVEEQLPSGKLEASTVSNLIEVGENLYRYELKSQDSSGVFQGNIGGVGIKYEYGVYINSDGSYIEPVLFSTEEGKEFDYPNDIVPSERSMRMYRDLETLRLKEGEHLKTDGDFLNTDTKNLTSEEVEDWVWRNFSIGMGTPDYHFYTEQGWNVKSYKNQDDGLVYADIIDEKGQIVWSFRVDEEGYLQTNKGFGSGMDIDWTTVARRFTDSGR